VRERGQQKICRLGGKNTVDSPPSHPEGPFVKSPQQMVAGGPCGWTTSYRLAPGYLPPPPGTIPCSQVGRINGEANIPSGQLGENKGGYQLSEQVGKLFDKDSLASTRREADFPSSQIGVSKRGAKQTMGSQIPGGRWVDR